MKLTTLYSVNSGTVYQKDEHNRIYKRNDISLQLFNKIIPKVSNKAADKLTIKDKKAVQNVSKIK